jgi:ligand-binding sensor domain-containing protein/two-component sensor histidine kinase
VKLHLLGLLLLFVIATYSQEYNYVHYDTKDGLAGSTVYRICQDKKGYLWFATDNGVSRFDGKRFKNFTTEDGLTDNDVIYISCDSKGRVWMMPFNKTVCFYYEGKIHNPKNDSTLATTLFPSWVLTDGETDQGDVYLNTSEGIFIYTTEGRIKKIADFQKLAEKFNVKASDFLAANMNNDVHLHRKKFPYRLLLFNGNKVFAQRHDSFFFYKKIRSNLNEMKNYFDMTDDLEPINSPDKLTPDNFSTNYLGNYQWMYNTPKGSWKFDSSRNYDTAVYLRGKKVSDCLRDVEGNLWFSTIGEGAYRLTSPYMKTFSNGQEAFCLEKSGDAIYAGYSNGTVQKIRNHRLEKTYAFDEDLNYGLSNRLYTMKKDAKGNLYLGFDLQLAWLNKNGYLFNNLKRAIKSLDIVDENTIVASTNRFTATFRTSDLKLMDTIWKDRSTKVIYDKGYYYIGTLDGIVIRDPSGHFTKLGGINPLLNKRIVDFYKMPDGNFWIATNDNGVLLTSRQKVNTVINNQNGLSSNICKSLFAKGHYLWVGTDKGINKIDINSKKVVGRYSVSDGLASNIINAIYIEDSIVWVCSPAGVTYFNEQDISDSSICFLDLTAVNISGAPVHDPANLRLSYRHNNISFEYSAISFKSAGEITYSYKLNGLDTDWIETKLTTLSYPSLPPGQYEFQLYATNKYGKKSEMVSIPFSINAPFWRTIWFWLAACLLATGIVWYLLSLRYKRLRKRLKERNEITKRMTELEQASLRAQMNPHFIFNCLNSIQHFILKDDVKATNRYITQFGSLIRKTMDNSTRAVISIADEINYLTSYLELEQMRFPLQFRYEIIVDPAIDPEYTYIPSMLLQPFVENGIRHGIRNKQHGKGMISIRIEQTPEDLLIVIEDNGVGREAASQFRGEQPIEYQSRGITLTQKRIDILNEANEGKVKTSIIDLKDGHGCALGTRVILSFPLSIIEKNMLQ